MASTFTTNIRLTKQGNGDNPNTWGQVLNDGVISLVDAAVAGYTRVSLGSAATVTLTQNQGSGDQARSAVLEFHGSIGTAFTSIFVLIPNNSKTYGIKNSVSTNAASNAVIMRVAGNAGVTVPNGGNGYFFTNGTSVYTLDATGLGLGTAALRTVGTCATNLPDTAKGDIRYVKVSATDTIVAEKTFNAGVGFAATVSYGDAAMVKVSSAVKSFITTLTDAVSVESDADTGNIFLVTLGGNRTLAKPTNVDPGQSGHYYLIQDATGGRTVAFNSQFKFAGGVVPVATSAAGATDILFYTARSQTTIDAVMLNNMTR
jgi:hypothetical protein